MAKRAENEYGLTFEEWLAAAGGRAHVEAVMAFGMTPRAAWQVGEDPTEYRAADASRIRALKESNMAIGFTKMRQVNSNQAGDRSSTRTLALDVYLGSKKIDTVFQTSRGTNAEIADEVRRSLIGHDGYDPNIRVTVRRGNLAKSESNRAGTKKTRKSPLTAATRVATLASLGVSYDPSLFYSVKGGKLYARERTGGGGYGRGRLGKARLLGTIPGFKKSLFYSVSNGVVSARRRK